MGFSEFSGVQYSNHTYIPYSKRACVTRETDSELSDSVTAVARGGWGTLGSRSLARSSHVVAAKGAPARGACGARRRARVSKCKYCTT